MKCKILIALGTFVIIACYQCWIFGQPLQVDTLSLTFDRVDTAPFCFIPHRIVHRPRVGLALSGGGARGFAQIGVLQVLEQEQIPIDFIVGSSMGSIIGGLYAAGYTPDQIEAIASRLDWSNIMVDKPPRTNLFISQKQEQARSILQLRFKHFRLSFPRAISPGQKLTSILTDLTLNANYQTSTDFDQLKVPFRALSCDLVTGQKVVISKGNLAEAMRASSAVPLLLAPVVKDSMLLVDGGLVNNIPVDEVKNFKVDLVIGVDTVSKLRPKEKLDAPWIIADQVTTIMQKEKNAKQRNNADVLIKLDLEDYKSDSFEYVKEIIAAGRQKAAKYVDHIKTLIKQKRKNSLSQEQLRLGSIIIDCANSYTKNIARDIIGTELKMASYHEIYVLMEKIYKTGYFDDVKAVCVRNDSLLSVQFLLTSNPILSAIVFQGNTVFADSMLQAQLESELGVPINYDRSKHDLLKIIGLYKRNGYALIKIDTIRLANDTLKIHLDEGSISSISIEGNERTKDYVILREFPLEPGDIFNLKRANEGLNHIYSTDLFENVSFEVFRNKPRVQLIIKVREKAFNLFRLGYRHDLERGSKGMIELVDENFSGAGNQISLHTQYGKRDQVIRLNFRADRIFKSYLTNNFEVFYSHAQNYVYSGGKQIGEYLQKQTGFSWSFGRQIQRLGVFSLTASLNSIQLQHISGVGYPTGKFEFKTIALQSIVDTQDQFPFPKSGKYYKFFYKLSSAKFLNSQISFVKLFNSLEFYHTFWKRNTIHPRIFWGTSDLTTPFIEQYRIGGIASFYGLRENEKIGRHVIVASLEYRYLFPFGFPIKAYWSVRYDIGATWKNQLDIKIKDFIHGLGTSIALETPLGPIALAIGKSSPQKSVWYFSAGFNF